MFKLVRLSVKSALFFVSVMLGAYSASQNGTANHVSTQQVVSKTQNESISTTELAADPPNSQETIANPVKWVFVICCLPWFVIGLIRYLVRQESNVVNGLTLASLTLACASLACFTIAIGMEGWLWLVSLIAATLVAMIYNIWIMSIAVKLES